VRRKDQQRQEARRLRLENGLSVGQIAAALNVSKSSASLWVRDIELRPVHKARYARLTQQAGSRGTAGNRAKARTKRLRYQHDGRRQARLRNPLHIMGCMLYWSEGSKERNSVMLANSDPDMLRLFLEFLRQCYSVRDDQITLTCNCFSNNGLALEEIQKWWLERIGLPRSCLRKAIVNRGSPAGTGRRRTLPYGTARLAVHSTRIIQSIYGAIQEYAGMTRPEWLDMPRRRQQESEGSAPMAVGWSDGHLVEKTSAQAPLA
jgi:hypothetical protein